MNNDELSLKRLALSRAAREAESCHVTGDSQSVNRCPGAARSCRPTLTHQERGCVVALTRTILNKKVR